MSVLDLGQKCSWVKDHKKEFKKVTFSKFKAMKKVS